VAVVLILSVTFALALAMFISERAASRTVQNVSSNLDTTISVVPAGSFGFGGGGNPLTAADVTKIRDTAHVTAVSATVTDRLSNENASSSGFGGGTGGTTSLTSPISPGTLGHRFGSGGNGSGFTPPAGFTLPVTVVGTTTPLNPASLNATTVKLTKGAVIDGTSSLLSADVGSTLATKNSLTVGSTFTAYGKTITVVGIFTTNTAFADAQFVLPLATEQHLSGISGVTSVTVKVDSLAHVQSTATALRTALGSSVADVNTGTGTTSASSDLSNIRTIAIYGLVGAVVASAAILLLVMLMIVRERRREIGILKAFGSSNRGIVSMFVSEAFTVTVLAGIVGTLLGIALSNPILHLLRNSSTGSTQPGNAFGSGGFSGRAHLGGFGFGGNALNNLHTVVGVSSIVVALVIVLGIALIGSAAPAYAIAKVRPAEVMRND
jgi:putative ABC transport system permease protein